MQCTLTKKSARRMGAAKAAKAKVGDTPTAFDILDNEDASFTIFGTNSQGDHLDISAVATATVSSDNEAVLTVDPMTGMTGVMHGVVPIPPPAPGTVLGTANLTAVATWNDGSVGPFTYTLNCTVTYQPSAPNGIVIVINSVTVRP